MESKTKNCVLSCVCVCVFRSKPDEATTKNDTFFCVFQVSMPKLNEHTELDNENHQAIGAREQTKNDNTHTHQHAYSYKETPFIFLILFSLLLSLCFFFFLGGAARFTLVIQHKYVVSVRYERKREREGRWPG